MRDRAPTGLSRRRQRLSDEETEQRMLDTALDMVNLTGLTVGLDHIGLEDVIRDAGVSRSAVYRRWPYKDLFFSDLLRQIAKAATPAVADAGAALELINGFARDHLDWLESPEGRRRLCAEMLRLGAAHDFEAIHGSTEWRTYLALHATFLSLEDGELRDDVRESLGRAERAFVERIASRYRHLAGLLGYRLRAELGATFETMATLAQATMRGMVTMALSTPEVATLRLRSAPLGEDRPADWSLPALGIAATAFTFLEPDPAVTWDAGRMAEVGAALS
ncbi:MULTISPECIES: TetR/AcrR family transcriptional regulator [Nonomuraea]|uniref:TetR/AcrR family transcriptional regulator n=1 Tax=Nonomuraea mangrovi TaxID=2316207 RepID=A0ABW4T1F7_9ACTN